MRPDGEVLAQHEELFLRFKDLAGIGELTAAAPKVCVKVMLIGCCAAAIQVG